MRLAAALALLMVATTGPAMAETEPVAETASAVETIQGKADAERRLTVPVTIGGQGPYHFVIDTGAQRSLVASSVAGRLALPPGQTLNIVDIGGRQQVATALADELAIGSRTYRDLVMPVLADEHLAADGVVGTDNLQGQRVVLDFSRNQMLIGSASEVGGNKGYEIVVKARRKSGRLIITEAVIEGSRVSVVIDTGAETSIGNRSLQRLLTRRGQTQPIKLISVTGAEIVADLAPFSKLSLGEVTIANPLIAFADSPVFAALGLEKRPAMMLGMRELRLFKRVAIDFSSRRVMLDIPPGA